jgi:UDP-N-acetylmuramoyl-L-alanyl-D-glutamate--2,6-diaminopimelate ligase
MGQAAEQVADRVVLTNDNPRREAPAAIIDEIIAGMSKPSLVEVEHDRSLAIRAAVSQSAPGDVILVAGKGHENYQQIGAARVAFNDGEQVKQALQLWKTQQR